MNIGAYSLHQVTRFVDSCTKLTADELLIVWSSISSQHINKGLPGAAFIGIERTKAADTAMGEWILLSYWERANAYAKLTDLVRKLGEEVFKRLVSFARKDDETRSAITG